MKMTRTISLILFISILFGFVLLALVYLFPATGDAEKAYYSSLLLEEEELYITEPFSGQRLDNATDTLMLLTAEYDGSESIFKKAALNYRLTDCDYNDYWTYILLHKDGSTGELVQKDYGRYWHGYLLFLRPLLLFFSYGAIRKINFIIQCLLLSLLILLFQRKKPQCTIPFLIMILFMAPTAVGKSLQFSGVYYIMLVFTGLILIAPKEIIQSDKVFYLFMLTGILTAFIDLLTAPTVTLTVPLAVLCVRLSEDKKHKKTVINVILCCLFWGLGYGIMWAGKWVIAAIFQGHDFIESLFFQMQLRSGLTNVTEKSSRINGLSRSLEFLIANKYLFTFTAIYSAAVFAVGIYNKRSKYLQNCCEFIAMLIPAALPFAWILVLNQHTAVHAWFTYRTLTPVIFCGLTVLNMQSAASLSSG